MEWVFKIREGIWLSPFFQITGLQINSTSFSGIREIAWCLRSKFRLFVLIKLKSLALSTEHSYNDETLTKLFRTQPEQAIEILFREFYPDICRSVMRIIPDPGIAEDIAQDVFFELWRKREVLNIKSSFGAYLRRAARNKALNYIRDRKIKPEGEDQLPQRIDSQTDANQKLEAQDLQNSIDQAVKDLPERCRQVFSLSRFEEMSYREIADHLGISIKTVENQISKALRLLRKALGPHLSWFVGFITFIFPL